MHLIWSPGHVFNVTMLQDLRAMLLIFSVQPPKQLNKILYESLQYILHVCQEQQQHRADVAAATNTKLSAQRRRNSSAGSSHEEENTEETGLRLFTLEWLCCI